MTPVKLLYFADIFCPWCYSFAPSMLRLSAAYPNVPVQVVGGNLISPATSLLYKRMREPGLGQFWQSVQQESGRSFAGILDALASQRDVGMDSLGADAVYLALAQLAPGHELEQFTSLEEMFFAEGKDLFADDTLASLADKWSVSVQKLIAETTNPALRKKAEDEIADVSNALGQSSFPTVFLYRGNRGEFVSQGYVPYETVAARMADVMADLRLEPLTPHEKMSRSG